MASIREYMKLVRVEYIGFAYMAILGALAVAGAGAEARLIVPIAFVNVMVLMWTFAHNDYCDLSVDRMNEELDERVLVKGTVSRRSAAILIAVGMLLGLLGSIIPFQGPLPTLALLLSFAFAFVYNMYSKRLPGADFLFAASATCLCLFGVCAATAYEQVAIPSIVWCLLGVVFVEHLFFNMIEGGLKDVDLDGKSGIKTIARRLIECDPDGTLRVGLRFRVMAYGLKALTVALVFLPFVFMDEPWTKPQMAILVFNAVLAFYYMHRLVDVDRFDWQRMGFDMIKQEMAARTLMPFMLLDRIGWGWAIGILAAPMVWHTSTVWFVHRRLFALPKRF